MSRKYVESQNNSRITSQIEKDYNIEKKKLKNVGDEKEILKEYQYKIEKKDNEFSEFEYLDFFHYKYDKFHNVDVSPEKIYNIFKEIDDNFLNKPTHFTLIDLISN